jgi:hypothetical protein
MLADGVVLGLSALVIHHLISLRSAACVSHTPYEGKPLPSFLFSELLVVARAIDDGVSHLTDLNINEGASLAAERLQLLLFVKAGSKVFTLSEGGVESFSRRPDFLYVGVLNMVYKLKKLGLCFL